MSGNPRQGLDTSLVDALLARRSRRFGTGMRLNGGPLAYQSIQPPQPGYWYYCPSAGAYYPAVGSCPEPWVPVPPSGG